MHSLIEESVSSIIFVGAGGIGGYAIPSALQILSTTPDITSQIIDGSIKIIIIDPDKVEEKNIIRQNFIYGDIGEYKAKVIAQRYGSIYNIPVHYVTEKLDIAFLNKLNIHGALFVDMVDKLKPRYDIHKYMKEKTYESYWISSGNSDDEGQVIFSSSQPISYNNEKGSLIMHYYYDNIVTMFPEQFTPEKLQEEEEEENRVNCAIQSISKPQTMIINRLAALHVVGMIFQLLHDMEPKYYMVEFDRFGKNRPYKYGEIANQIDNKKLKELLKKMSKTQAT